MEGAVHCAQGLINLVAQTGRPISIDAYKNIMRDAEHARDSIMDHGSRVVDQATRKELGAGPSTEEISETVLEAWRSYITRWDTAIRAALGGS
jgi:hypothetical protein